MTRTALAAALRELGRTFRWPSKLEWRIARREILLDQSVLLAKNLTVFF